MLKFEIRDRFVYFRVKEVRNGRIIYQFESSTRVPFDERDVVLTCDVEPRLTVGPQRSLHPSLLLDTCLALPCYIPFR